MDGRVVFPGFSQAVDLGMEDGGVEFKAYDQADGVNVDPHQDDHQSGQGAIQCVVIAEVVNVEIETEGRHDDQDGGQHGAG